MKKMALFLCLVSVALAKKNDNGFVKSYQKCLSQAYENPVWVYHFMDRTLSAIAKRSQFLLEKSRVCLEEKPKSSNETKLQTEVRTQRVQEACKNSVRELEMQATPLDGYLVQQVHKINDSTAQIRLKAYTPLDLLMSTNFLRQPRELLISMITMQTIQDQVQGQLMGYTENNPLQARSFAWTDVRDEAMESMQCLMKLVDLNSIKMQDGDIVQLNKADQAVAQGWFINYYPEGGYTVRMNLSQALKLKMGDMISGNITSQGEHLWVDSLTVVLSK